MKRITLFALTAFALLLGFGTLTAATTSAQQTPAQTLVGQSVTACKADVRFRFSVVSADWTARISDRDADPATMWAVAVADVTNLSAGFQFSQGMVKVQDDQQRLFPWRLFNGEDLYVETDTADAYGVMPSWEGIEQGATVRTVLIFPVATNARSLTLLASDLSCPDAPVAGSLSAPTSSPAPASSPAPVLSIPPVPVVSATPAPVLSAPPAPVNSPAPAVVTTTAPVNAATSLIGQSVIACKGELRFRFSVVQAETRQMVVDRPARAGAMWVVAIADVTNLGTFSDSGQGLAKVRDNQGREFAWRLFNGENIYVEDQIAAEFGLRASWEISDPGISNRTVLLFEVESTARTLTLLPDNIGCGG